MHPDLHLFQLFSEKKSQMWGYTKLGYKTVSWEKNFWIIFLTLHSTPSGPMVIKYWRFILMCKNPALFLWEMVRKTLGGSGIVYIYQVKWCLLTNKLHKYFSLILKRTKKKKVQFCNLEVLFFFLKREREKKERKKKNLVLKGPNTLVEKCSWVNTAFLARLSFMESWLHQHTTN